MVSIIIGVILVLECVIFFVAYVYSETPASDYWNDFRSSLWEGHKYAYTFVVFALALFVGIYLIVSGLSS